MKLNKKINRLLDEATTVNYARRYEAESEENKYTFLLWVLENENIIFYVKQEVFFNISYGERIDQLIRRLRNRFDKLLQALNTESTVAEKLPLNKVITLAIRECSTPEIAKGYAKAESKFVYALECIEHSDAFIEHEVDLSAFNMIDKPNRVENAVERLENRLDKLNGVAS